MKRFALVSMFALVGCTDMDAAGVYNGTLTLNLPLGPVMLASAGSLTPGQFELHATNTTPASCLLQQKAQHGTTISFNCATAPCYCGLDTTSLIVTAASGMVADAVLSLQFSGEVGQGDAFTGAFMGTHE